MMLCCSLSCFSVFALPWLTWTTIRQTGIETFLLLQLVVHVSQDECGLMFVFVVTTDGNGGIWTLGLLLMFMVHYLPFADVLS